jgi:hypothetical protein
MIVNKVKIEKSIALLFIKLSIISYNITIKGKVKSQYLVSPKIDEPSSRN